MSHPPGGAAAAAEPGALPGSAPVVLPGFANARDLGGLQTEDGRCTRSGAVIRSEIPRESLASEDLAVALRISFGRVIDLRSDDEVIDTPHPLQPLPGYRHLPLIDPQAELDRDPDAEQSLAQVYCGSVERNTATIGAILAEIAGAPDAPILISCTAGKDRTGMIAAMLLELARVRRPQIGEDYARTEEQLRSAFDGAASDGDDARAGWRHSEDCQPANIVAMLEHIDDEYGSIVNYLRGVGVSEIQLVRLGVLLRER